MRKLREYTLPDLFFISLAAWCIGSAVAAIYLMTMAP